MSDKDARTAAELNGSLNEAVRRLGGAGKHIAVSGTDEQRKKIIIKPRKNYFSQNLEPIIYML